MPALVPELVNMASNPSVSTTEILRRALVVAGRLAVPNLSEWIKSELNGYDHAAAVPEYRVIYGQLVVFNHVRGVDIPCDTSDDETAAFLRRHEERQPIPVLEQMVVAGGRMWRGFPAEVERQMLDRMEHRMRPKLLFSKHQTQGIVEIVRNRILQWGLELEEKGILGEGLSFTPQEKQAVQALHYHISNVSGSQIQISSNESTQSQTPPPLIDSKAVIELVEALEAVLGTMQGDKAEELRAETATLRAQSLSPKPKWEVIKATARTIKTVAEGAAGGILAALAQPQMATLLALAAA